MPKTKEHKILERLDAIAEVLQNIFILEALDAKMPVEKIRKILGIDKKRINRISKHVKED